MAKVKCGICGEYFDREKVKCVRFGANRYAHFSCNPEGIIAYEPSPEEEAKYELQQYICEKQGLKTCGPHINKEITQMHEQNEFTYSGMLKSLKWWYEVEKHPIDARFRGTVAIINRIYYSAQDYYAKIFLAQDINKDKDIEEYKPIVREVEIPSPRRKIKPHIKLFNLEEDD